MKNNLGFTLIELLVASGVFIIIISIAVGSFFSALRSQRQIVSLMNINNNLSLVLEQISREIRTGYDFCINPNSCNINQLSFVNANGQSVVYRLQGSAIEKDIGSGFKKITSDNIIIDYLNFIVTGNNPNDQKQPRITIILGVKSSDQTVSNLLFKIQTTISPRILDS